MNSASGAASFASPIEAAEESLDAQPAMPPDDTWRNFVAEREQRDRGMATKLADRGDDLLRIVRFDGAIVEKRHVLRSTACPTITRRP